MVIFHSFCVAPSMKAMTIPFAPEDISSLLFCGSLGVIWFFSALIFGRARERIYLYYGLFIFFSILETVFYLHKGKSGILFFSSSPLRTSASIELFTLLAFGFYCLFCVKLLNIKGHNKPLFYWICSMAAAAITYGLLLFIFTPKDNEVWAQAFLISRLVIFTMSIVGLVWILIKVDSSVKGYFVVGSVCYLLGAFIAVIRATVPGINFVEFYMFTPQVYFQWGIFMEIICFTLALTYRVYFQYLEKQRIQEELNEFTVLEKERAQAEALALRIQINPHLLFNYLNLLKYHIQTNENTKAIDYLVKFSRFIRKIINFNEEDTVSLHQEIEILQQYLELEKIRFSQDFSYAIEIDQEIPLDEIMLPPMLLQPFVEEAVWANSQYENAGAKNLAIRVRAIEDDVVVEIEATVEGETMADSTSSDKYQKNSNRQITAKRIALFNKNQKSEIEYEVYNRSQLFGTNKLACMKLVIRPNVEKGFSKNYFR